MTKNKVISQQHFEKTLSWLDPDKEIAGQKYESIRLRLIKIFNTRHCPIAEELADETIDRVIKKIDELVGVYQGNPALYFYGVGKYVLSEYFRLPKSEELSPSMVQAEDEIKDITPIHKCLKICLQNLSEEQRDLIIDYYQKDKQAKIDNRKLLAQKKGESKELLRTHVYRIRGKLQKCIKKCAGEV